MITPVLQSLTLHQRHSSHGARMGRHSLCVVNLGDRASLLLVARTLLGAPGLRNKKLLVTKGIATGSKDAWWRGGCFASRVRQGLPNDPGTFLEAGFSCRIK